MVHMEEDDIMAKQMRVYAEDVYVHMLRATEY